MNTGPWGEVGPAGGGPGNVLSLLHGEDRKQISDDKGLGASWPFWAFVIEYGQVACTPPGALGPAPCPACALGQPRLEQVQPHAFCQAFCQEPWLGHCPRTDCGRTQSCWASVCQGGKSPSNQEGTPPHRRVLAGGAEGAPSGPRSKAPSTPPREGQKTWRDSLATEVQTHRRSSRRAAVRSPDPPETPRRRQGREQGAPGWQAVRAGTPEEPM